MLRGITRTITSENAGKLFFLLLSVKNMNISQTIFFTYQLFKHAVEFLCRYLNYHLKYHTKVKHCTMGSISWHALCSCLCGVFHVHHTHACKTWMCAKEKETEGDRERKIKRYLTIKHCKKKSAFHRFEETSMGAARFLLHAEANTRTEMKKQSSHKYLYKNKCTNRTPGKRGDTGIENDASQGEW